MNFEKTEMDDYRSQVRRFYDELESVWINGDRWHEHTKASIDRIVLEWIAKFDRDDINILNAGAGDCDYGYGEKVYNIDVSGRHVGKFKKHHVCSVENMPFPDESFEIAICVGSVLNYCEAELAIYELSRVLKPGGLLLLEFESSRSFEYIFTRKFNMPKTKICTSYNQEEHRIIIFSPAYIKRLLASNKLKVKKNYYIHILSALLLRFINSEKSAKAAEADKVFSKLPPFRHFAGNMLFVCMKE